PAFEVRAVPIAVEWVEVVPVPDRVDAQVLGAADGLGIGRVAGLLRGQLHPDADTRHVGSSHQILSKRLVTLNLAGGVRGWAAPAPRSPRWEAIPTLVSPHLGRFGGAEVPPNLPGP